MAAPPPLPPRDTSQLPPPPPLPPRDTSQLPPPPPYSAVEESQGSLNSGQENRLGGSILGSKVPRPSSSLSLAPSSSDLDGKRTLLLVYIHGFYGNDQSFQSFPRHVHNMIRETLSETHAVYSKVYPRYKTYKPIEVARDNFSAWLEPHESPTTDVILIGHSMGGLLAAEVILMSNWISSSRQPLRHRILGSLSLDSPFLGLHPGIVASGLSSLFHPSPAPTPPNQDAASLSSGDLGPSSPASFNNTPSGSRDPNFDPPYFNDSPFREQPFLTRMFHFSSKHWSEGIFTALAHHVAAHLEFGGCLADYPGLKARYNQLRALEDIDEFQNLSATSYNIPRPRVRFLNYYTLSSGRPKQPAGAKGSQSTSQVDLSTESVPEIKIQDQINDKLVHAIISARLEDEEKNQADESLSNIKITVKDDDDLNKLKTAHLGSHEDEKIVDTNSMAEQEELEEKILDKNRLSTQSIQSIQSMQNIDPIPMDDEGLISVEQELESAVSDISDRPPSSSIENKADEKNDSSETDLVPPNLDLPPIPDLPNPPEQPDLSQYTDKDARKQAEREFSRRQKAHEQAAKDRAKAIREREKLIEKLQKKAQKGAQKDADKLEKDTKKQQQKSEQDKRKLEKEEEKAAKAEKKQLEKEEEKAAKAEKKRLEKEEEKAAKAEKKRLEKEAAAAAKQRAMAAASSQAAASSTSSLAASSVASPYSETEAETPGGKRKKLGKFCTTPHKTNGVMDPTWVSVFMDGMDEVTAHCGLFFPGPHYDRLVGDVSGRIVSWVQHNLSVRTVLEMGPK